jgi:hypothetical protein
MIHSVRSFSAACRRRVIWVAAMLAAVVLPGICSADGLIVIDNPPHVPIGHFTFAPL